MTPAQPPSEPRPAAPVPPRRRFLAAAAAVAAGAAAVLGPIAAGVVAFLTPLFRKPKSPQVRLALLDQVPADGQPRFFPVVSQRDDAWTRYDQSRVGGVYLVREPGADAPYCLAAKCPHAGCFIGYAAGSDRFQCPCHTSAFLLDGKRVNGDASVSPRDMDRMPVELRSTVAGDAQQTEIWIEFVDFQTGHKEPLPSV